MTDSCFPRINVILLKQEIISNLLTSQNLLLFPVLLLPLDGNVVINLNYIDSGNQVFEVNSNTDEYLKCAFLFHKYEKKIENYNLTLAIWR